MKLSPFQKHAAAWKACRRCNLCETRKNVVLARGKVPCDILFCGEAPGISEDVIGKPFCGPAGKLFDQIIEQALPVDTRYVLTNLIACLPVDEDGNKATEPDAESIEQCRPRLEEFVKIAAPKLIVCVGKLAETWLAPGYKHSPNFAKIPQVSVTHPAAILRANVATQGLAVKKCVVTIADAWREAQIPF